MGRVDDRLVVAASQLLRLRTHRLGHVPGRLAGDVIVTAAVAAAFWVAFLARLVWVRREVYRAAAGGRDLRS